MSKILQLLILSTLLLLHTSAQCQNNKDSVFLTIYRIDALYQKEKISKKEHLDTIQSTMRQIFYTDISLTNRELLELLSSYRKTIWQNNNEDNKQDYYGILSNESQKNGRLGEMRYYAEKINEIEQKENKHPSITALTILADYYNTLWSFKNTQELYIADRDFIKSVPQKAKNGELDIRQMVQAGRMLERIIDALFAIEDTLNGNEAIYTLEQLTDIAKNKYADQHYELAHLEFSLLHSLCTKENKSHSKTTIKKALLKLGEFQQDKNTPENLKYSAAFYITDLKIVSFLDEKNTDSALHYISILDNMLKNQSDPYNKYILQKYKSRLLHAQGLYKKSIDTLIDAMLISEEIRKEIVKDVNEMMYAQTKVDEQQILLIEAASLQQKTRTQLIVAGIGLLSILIGSFVIIIWYRHTQKTKFLNFKINLARNLHDETNPMLLYAKSLLRYNTNSNTENNSTLEKHLDHTMEVIRSLSHDLKLDKHHTLMDLTNHTKKLLEKLNIDNTTYQFNISKNIDGKRFISHYQFNQLKAIINECIANTIKHASFHIITVKFKQYKNQLEIEYSDDGKGWDTQLPTKGIGLDNMRERSELLNGNLTIDNLFPNGYKISVNITLR